MTQRATEDAARAAAQDAARIAVAPAPPPKPAQEPWADWAERFFANRDAREADSSKDNRSHFRTWVPPELKAKPMVEITKFDLEGIVELLDDAVIAEEIRWKTAVNVWGTITVMFGEAYASKRRALRVLTTNPCTDIVGPDRGAETVKVYLFPVEFMAMMTCDRIPIRWKRLFALSVYLYPRPGELEALHLEDINLQHRYVFFHRATDRKGDEKETKTGISRRVPIEPALVPLLERMMEEAREEGEELLLRMPPECDLSTRLRQYLRWAGVTRAELFVTDRTRTQITFYDLRATGITWTAIRGEEPLKIMQRAGHLHFSTTQGYIRAAEELGHAVGAADVFAPLPDGVFSAGISAEGPAAWANLRGSQWKGLRPQRDSNPRNSLERAGSWAGLDDGDRWRGAGP